MDRDMKAARAPSVESVPSLTPSDFYRELKRGSKMYDGRVGRWWLGQNQDAAHRRAYDGIARWIRASLWTEPEAVTDYACGSGDMLARLRTTFPRARLRGLDASSLMVEEARKRVAALEPKVEGTTVFSRAALPNLRLGRGTDDLVVFMFPNLAGIDDKLLTSDERRIGKHFSRASDPEAENPQPPEDPADDYEALCAERAVTNNIHHILKPGGSFVKVEYADCKREEMTALSQQRIAFETGSLGDLIQGVRLRKLFKLAKSEYFPSKIVEDVAAQTGNESDRTGGYTVERLVAL